MSGRRAQFDAGSLRFDVLGHGGEIKRAELNA